MKALLTEVKTVFGNIEITNTIYKTLSKAREVMKSEWESYMEDCGDIAEEWGDPYCSKWSASCCYDNSGMPIEWQISLVKDIEEREG